MPKKGIDDAAKMVRAARLYNSSTIMTAKESLADLQTPRSIMLHGRCDCDKPSACQENPAARPQHQPYLRPSWHPLHQPCPPLQRPRLPRSLHLQKPRKSVVELRQDLNKTEWDVSYCCYFSNQKRLWSYSFKNFSQQIREGSGRRNISQESWEPRQDIRMGIPNPLCSHFFIYPNQSIECSRGGE